MRMNNKLINGDSGVNGIFRCKLIAGTDVSDIRVFIPGISTINPYNSDGTLNLEAYNNHKESFPKVQWCCYNVESKELDNQDSVGWCMFENGDFKKPVVLSYAVIGGDGTITTTDSNVSVYTINPNISTNEYIYPLSQKHTLDPFSGRRYFGASRDDGKRAHAGIDLIVPENVDVIAAMDGEVDYICQNFFAGTDAVAIKNSDGTWFNYAELKPKVSIGQKIIKGQVIGTVIANNSSGASMLHFEAYKGDYDSNVLNNNGSYLYVPNKNYERRADLIDPSFVVNLPMYNEGS